MNYYRIRIDAFCFQDFKDFFDKYGRLSVIVFETPQNPKAFKPENPHYHALFESALSLDALRKARTRSFSDKPKMKGNGPCSIAKCDKLEEYKEYLCKGRFNYKYQKKYYKVEDVENAKFVDVRFNESISSIETYYERFWHRHQTIETIIEQKKKFNFTTKLIEDFKNDFENVVDPDEVPDEVPDEDINEVGLGIGYLYELPKYEQFSMQKVINWLINYFCKHLKIWDNYIICRYANMIHWRYIHHFDSLRRSRKSQILKIWQMMGCSGEID